MTYTDYVVMMKKNGQKVSYLIDETYRLVAATIGLMSEGAYYFNRCNSEKELDSVRINFKAYKNEVLKCANNLMNIGEEQFRQYITSLEHVQIDTFNNPREWADYVVRLTELGLQTSTQ